MKKELAWKKNEKDEKMSTLEFLITNRDRWRVFLERSPGNKCGVNKRSSWFRRHKRKSGASHV